jgi:hypothetical protein
VSGFEHGGIVQNRLALQLCAELGISAEQTTGARVELLPNGQIVATWEGRQTLTLEQVNAVLLGVECDAEHLPGQPCSVCGLMRGRPHEPVWNEA